MLPVHPVSDLPAPRTPGSSKDRRVASMTTPPGEDVGLERVHHTKLRVGQVWLDVAARRLHCLNDTARQFRAEGLPLTEADHGLGYLRTLSGEPVAGERLPLVIAARQGRPAEDEFILARPGIDVRHLHWSAVPLRNPQGQVTAVFASVSERQPPPDW